MAVSAALPTTIKRPVSLRKASSGTAVTVDFHVFCRENRHPIHVWDSVIRTLSISAILLAATATGDPLPGRQPHAANPIIAGYFADPSLTTEVGHHYLYATLDPWGGATLGCWESADFKSWTYRVLNWPTKAACTSPTSTASMVWAPSVVRAADGKFHMYVSVGSEVWAGVADHPLGPWHDANGGKPLIAGNFRPGFHMIDAEAFIDTDGQAYLYWGSGLNWVNGKCWVVKLKPDMVTFDGEVRDVTPGHYFEGPFMVKHGGRYYLMYSNGKTIEDTYQVHYAIGDSPLGPFTEAANSPCLVSDLKNNVRAPGHHAVFEKDGRQFILYHRQSIPFDPQFIGRQLCVDELKFTADGLIEKVVPTHAGPAFIQRRAQATEGVVLTASSQRNPPTTADMAIDDNHATLWAAAAGDSAAWIQMDLGRQRSLTRQEIRFEYAWKTYRFLVEASADGKQWQPMADHRKQGVAGSPVVISAPASARYLKISFPASGMESEPAIFEWTVQ